MLRKRLQRNGRKGCCVELINRPKRRRGGSWVVLINRPNWRWRGGSSAQKEVKER